MPGRMAVAPPSAHLHSHPVSHSHALTLSPGVVLGSGGRCAAAAAAAAAASSAAAAFGEKGVRLAQKGASWRMHSRGVAAARGWSWPNV